MPFANTIYTSLGTIDSTGVAPVMPNFDISIDASLSKLPKENGTCLRKSGLVFSRLVTSRGPNWFTGKVN